MRRLIIAVLFLALAVSALADGSIKTLRYPVARGSRTDPLDIYAGNAVFISTFEEPYAMCAVDTSTNGNFLKFYTACTLTNDVDPRSDVGSAYIGNNGTSIYNVKQGNNFHLPNLTNRLATCTNWTIMGRMKVPTDDNGGHNMMNVQDWYPQMKYHTEVGLSWYGSYSCAFLQVYTNNVKLIELDSANVLQNLTGQWIHVAFVYDNSVPEYRCYTNGYQLPLSITNGTPVAGWQNTSFYQNPRQYYALSFAYEYGNGTWWGGGPAYYDDYAFYTRTLSAAEILASAQSSTNVPNDPTNLVYRYQFTNYPYLGVVNDFSGRNNDAAMKAQIPYWDKGAYVCEYEQGFTWPDNTDFEFPTNSGGMTIIYDYMNGGVLSGQGCDILNKWDGDKYEWYIDSRGGQGGLNFRFGIYDTTGAGGAMHANIEPMTLAAGTPHQCVVTYTGGNQGTNVTLYVDGVKIANATKSGTFVSSGGSTSTMKFGGTASPNWAGYKVSSLRIFKGVAFSSNEVALVYQLHPPSF